MALLDNKKNINVSQVDMESWCKKLNCTEKQLRFCIQRVGTSWVCVEAFWSMNKDRIRKTFPDQKTTS